jgi:hypothetical protein
VGGVLRPHLPPERPTAATVGALFLYIIISPEALKRKGNKNFFMSWIGWVITGILAVNLLFIAVLGMIALCDRRRNRK